VTQVNFLDGEGNVECEGNVCPRGKQCPGAENGTQGISNITPF